MVSPALDMEIKAEVFKKPKLENETSNEVSGIVLKPKQETVVSKSAAQIVHEQRK